MFRSLQDTFLHTLSDPEMQKAAVSGPIQEIVVQPTEALVIQYCSEIVRQVINNPLTMKAIYRILVLAGRSSDKIELLN